MTDKANTANTSAAPQKPPVIKGCPTCGSFMVVGAGAYRRCMSCGWNSVGERLADPLNFTKGPAR